jgi:hypothetical protein
MLEAVPAVCISVRYLTSKSILPAEQRVPALEAHLGVCARVASYRGYRSGCGSQPVTMLFVVHVPQSEFTKTCKMASDT